MFYITYIKKREHCHNLTVLIMELPINYDLLEANQVTASTKWNHNARIGDQMMWIEIKRKQIENRYHSTSSKACYFIFIKYFIPGHILGSLNIIACVINAKYENLKKARKRMLQRQDTAVIYFLDLQWRSPNVQANKMTLSTLSAILAILPVH